MAAPFFSVSLGFEPLPPFLNAALADVEVETSIGTHVYEIREIDVVLPTDVWVVDPRPGGWLTMTTCEPKFSARQRLVVWAELVSGPNFDFIEISAASGTE